METRFRVVAAAAAALIMGAACGSQPQGESSPPPAPSSMLAERPILHMTAIGSSWSVVAVGLSGERTGTNAGWGFAWSPDGRSYASLGNDHRTLYIVSAQGVRQNLWTTPAIETLSIYWPPAAWSPDGTRIAVTTEDDTMAINERRHWLVVVDVARRTVVSKTELPWELLDNSNSGGDPPRNFAWSTNGTRVLINWDRTAVVEVSTGEVAKVTDTQSFADWIGPDTVGYFTVDERPSLSGFYSWNAVTARTTQVASARDLALANLNANPLLFFGHGLAVVSPDGTKLAVVTWKNSASDLKDGATIRIYTLPIGSAASLKAPLAKFDTGLVVLSADWSPDGRYIAYLGFNGGQTSAGSWSDVKGTVNLLDLAAGTSRSVDEVSFPSELNQVCQYAWHSLAWSS